MSHLSRWKALALPAAGVALLAGLAIGFGGGDARQRPAGAGPRLRLAYFPNLTHAPAVAGVGRGDFQNALGQTASIDAKAFNAGPGEMEARLAGEGDLSYA